VIAKVIAEGEVRTCDMGGKNTTIEFAQAIADYATA
jgi:isocitrate/isopropylmalate dehydrogenase